MINTIYNLILGSVFIYLMKKHLSLRFLDNKINIVIILVTICTIGLVSFNNELGRYDYLLIITFFVNSLIMFRGRMIEKILIVIPFWIIEIATSTVVALLKSYIETLEPGYKAGYRQVTENVINFAKILGLNTEKTTYLPEKIVKKRTIIDNQGYKTEDIFERTISSKLKLIEKGDDKAYGYVPQNTYLAEEPIRYQETQTVHNRIKSDTF